MSLSFLQLVGVSLVIIAVTPLVSFCLGAWVVARLTRNAGE